jgi:hypothetical protein
MMIAINMLIHIVSLEFQLPACITIHNQCSNTKLVSPIYFSNDAVGSKLFSQQIDIGTEVRTNFEINTIKNKFEGVLLFKLERYFDDQDNIDTSTTKANKGKATHVHIIVAWKVKNAKTFAYIALVENAKVFIWNEDKLKKLYYENHDWFKEYNDTISDTWLVNNMVLKTTFSARDLKGIIELNVSISEGKKSDYAMRPFRIHPER